MSRLSFSLSVVDRLLRSGYRVLVTGASGWLGRASLEMLSQAYGATFVERVGCFGSSSQTLQIRGGLSIDQKPLSDMRVVARGRYILLHFACLTKDRIANMSAEEYFAANRSISITAKEAAERVGVERVFHVSSGAVYQALAASGASGRAHPYGVIKLEDEASFRHFADERARSKVVTARLFNLSGPYINKLGSYALSSFIEQARDPSADAAIRINADHPVIRSYVAVGDLLNIAFAHLLDEATESYSCFDTAGECEVELDELAQTVKTVVNPNIPILRPAMSCADADKYVGDGTRFRFLATRYGVSLRRLREQVGDTAEYLGAS